MRFAEQVAVVTGGASGIGRATAERLASEGARVAILDIDEAGAVATADAITSTGAIAFPVVVDIGDESAVEDALDRVEGLIGLPTILVNCAGVLHVAPALETSPEAFDRIVRVNLRSVFVLSVSVARRLRAAERGGAIVNVSSIHAVLSEPNASAYTATKGGIEAMSRTFASEWAPLGIRVNCVRPGATVTALTATLYTPEILDALASRVPLRVPAQPEQVAAGICFLASADADYCTGTTLDVDGGYIMDGSLPRTEYR
ncbi:SDR family oxidoreductase [Microbacterium oxydans]|uniref:SDR family NAD(P)-dependent oxidoreductase n=1 Tax=Microbacterium sp. B19(2022) TaxID=2914045 RepID=UPI0014314325|nr:SDR family NAD(P)-dependent oxidoreductase [Microbacterium sp. B19(2022)]NJI59459.1 SDR family oxidoreductase [Microbacterium sp. B19(2022)]